MRGEASVEHLDRVSVAGQSEHEVPLARLDLLRAELRLVVDAPRVRRVDLGGGGRVSANPITASPRVERGTLQGS